MSGLNSTVEQAMGTSRLGTGTKNKKKIKATSSPIIAKMVNSVFTLPPSLDNFPANYAHDKHPAHHGINNPEAHERLAYRRISSTERPVLSCSRINVYAESFFPARSKHTCALDKSRKSANCVSVLN
jgi:hypothetical protein